MRRWSATLPVVETLLVHRTLTLRKDSGPRERNPRSGKTEMRHQSDIFRITMIEVAGLVCRVTVLNLTGGMREAVPYRLTFAVFVPCTLYLVSGARGAPEKIVRKSLRHPA